MANNLLDKSSIILTPTAYDNGTVLCVKPSDGSGDFDFSRNSAATRVNAQGLVENVQILSSNLVQNGDFSEEGVQEVSNGSFSQEGSELIVNGDFATDSDWTLTQATISNGAATFVTTDGSFAGIRQNVFTIGKTYLISLEVSNLVGTAEVNTNGGTSIGLDITSNGVKSFYMVAENTDIEIKRKFGITNVSATIDNCSVREVGQDWDLATGWSIAEDKAISDGVSSNSNLVTTSAFYSGSLSVKMTINVTDYVSGGLKIYLSSTNFTEITANGDYTFYTTADRTDGKMYLKSVNFNGSITNISVKEVGQNWNFTNVGGSNGWRIANDRAICDAEGINNGRNINSSTTLVNGKTYKLTLDILQSVDGMNVLIGSTILPNELPTGTNLGYEYYIDASQHSGGLFSIYGGSSDLQEIDNISVIEITDDTNLPRISYENFSYQDALGSELITSGNDTSNIVGLADNQNITIQTSFLTIGKIYKIDFEIYDYVEGSIFLLRPNDLGVGSAVSANGTYSYTVLANASTSLIFRTDGLSTTLKLKNISVKEYLGQEVVPDSGCGSWLWEPQSTNLITQSELFSDASWVKSGSSITSNAVISPDGNVNAAKLIASATNSEHRISASISTSATESISIFAKKDGYDFLIFRLSTSTNGFNNACFDLDNGQLGTIGSNYSNAKIEDFGNGWYRCSFVVTNRSGLNINVLAAEQDNVQSFLGDGTSGVYIWGAQIEALSYATSYIPTEGSTVTRNQDLCTNGGSLASINSTEGVLYAEIAALANDLSFRSIGLSDGTVNNRILILYTDASNGIRVLVFRNNLLQVILNHTINITDVNKVAVRYKFNDVSFWANGTKLSTDTNAFMPIGLNELSFSRGDGNLPFFGKTKALAVFPYLTDAELTELTTI